MSSLIIVESPAKAKTIKNFLGKDYTVIASKGHIVDLPDFSFGIKIDAGKFIPEYKITKDHKAVADEIKALFAKNDTVYIATDEDREGEAIGYHIAAMLGLDPAKTPRIVFHEITKKAILHALETPRTVDIQKVNAQQTRRLLDRIVGYKLSPLLGSKIQKGLSAGRVQSSALKIVVDREREIQAFIPLTYYTVTAQFDAQTSATLIEWKSKKIDKTDLVNINDVESILASLKNATFCVSNIENKERKTATPPPFMTSTLQQAASSQLGFSPKKTMSLAQSLYEGAKTHEGVMGLITYMRTDSLYITPEANEAAREYIIQNFGKKYLPKEQKRYKTKNEKAQEAHEAIRPTSITFTPEIAKKYLKDDELKLYTLIFNRFIASQMEDAKFSIQNIFFEAKETLFKASGRKLLFDGFYALLSDDDKDKILGSFSLNQECQAQNIEAKESVTEPPSRFSEAGLIKQLEGLGIGRPSTYAPTISTLQSRDYITIEKKQILPSPIAFTVTELLENHFNEIVESTFTATMEEGLDKIADEGLDWEAFLWEFYEPFIAKCAEKSRSIPSQKIVEPINEPCPTCGEMLVKRKGRFGEFISCSSYPKCKFTRKILKEGDETKNEPVAVQESDEKCEKCGSAMIIRSGRNGSFLACSAYPKCKNAKSLAPTVTLEVPCPLCGGALSEKNSKRGKFFGCNNYPSCNFISKYPVVAKKCPQCTGAMIAKTVRKKETIACLNSECGYKEEA